MESTWMLGLCAILMAQLHTIHCDTQETQTAEVQGPADPKMLIQMTNNFASILESLTRVMPANGNQYGNQYDAEMLNYMMAQQLQQPQQQTFSGPGNPNVGRPGNPTMGRPINPNTGRPNNPNTGRPNNPNTGRPGNPNSGRPGVSGNPNYNPFGPPTNPQNPNQPLPPQSPGGGGGSGWNPTIDRPIPQNPRDCNDVTAKAQSSRTNIAGNGVYMLTPQIYPVLDADRDIKPFAAFCDMETDGGNWTVFQRRSGPLVGFFRGWDEYKAGFGYLDGDHWLGLERLHQMTVHNRYELRVDLEDFQGNRAFATYDNFKIGDESTNYKLIVGAYQGTAKDSLTYHNNKPFTTRDRDNDAHKGSCARDYKGAWWYGNCHYSNLNGEYQMRALNNDVGMTWYAWKKRHVSLKRAEMKIRRVF